MAAKEAKMTEPLLVNSKKAAALLGVSQETFRELVRSGRLRGVVVSKRLMFSRSILEQFSRGEAS
jgi:excisionase family DNA binding protein